MTRSKAREKMQLKQRRKRLERLEMLVVSNKEQLRSVEAAFFFPLSL